jgi:alanine racemase
MNTPLRPTHLVINLSQLRRNVQAIRARVHPARVLVMLKANAYGHGLEGVAPYIEKYVDYIGVAVLDEGIALRRMGITRPILVAGGTLPEHVPFFLQHRLTLTVSEPLVLRAAEQASAAAGEPILVHLKIDTGMERAGVRWYEAESLLREAAACQHLRVEGIYTHFANSETLEDPSAPQDPLYAYASQQLARFEETLQWYERNNLPRPPLVHAANSAAILNLPQSYFDMVRPGILFYGIYPDDSALRSVQVEPAATWKSQVVYSKITRAGSPVSYGSLWATEADSRVVTIPCGYADGYFRRMTNQPKIIVNGKKYQQVGRICMDQCMANLQNDPAALGDEVILLGKASSGEKISPEDLAAWAGTNPYEVMTNIAARVPRVFLTEDE